MVWLYLCLLARWVRVWDGMVGNTEKRLTRLPALSVGIVCSGYRMSKAAVNAAGVSLARDLKPRGIAVALLHPGYVQTDMTAGKGAISATESVEGMLKRAAELNLDNSGSFWHSNGEVLPW